MRIYLTLILIIIFTSFTLAQVGVNTNSPQSTLDVRVVDPAAPTSDAGIAVPQVMNAPSSGNRVGQIVMNLVDTTYNYFNGSKWLPINHQVNYVGDLKHGLQLNDHGGWVRLDGRSINALTSNQKTNAIALGFLDDLPDANQVLLKSDNATNIGEINGDNNITILQSNLPSVNLTGVTGSSGVHSHNIKTRQDDWQGGGTTPSSGPSWSRDNGPYSVYHNTENSGAHIHVVNIPLGGSNDPINIAPKFINANSFIFLGQ